VIGADAEAFALNLNLAAAEGGAADCAARHKRAGCCRLRRMQAAKSQRAVAEAFRQALAAGSAASVMCWSCLARRVRGGNRAAYPAGARCAGGAAAAEREALDALREIETAGRAARAAPNPCADFGTAAQWLELDASSAGRPS
jgi:hypothetical protein